MKQKFMDHFMRLVYEIGNLSTCYKRSVGAIIVSPDYRILSTGYNGTPSGMIECKEVSAILEWVYDGYIIKISDMMDWDTVTHMQIIDSLESIRDKISTGDISKLNIDNEHVWSIIRKYKSNSTMLIETFSKLIDMLKCLHYNELKNYRNQGITKFIADFNFVHYKYEIHAEQNAIAQAASHGINIKGCTIFIPIMPCLDCARLIVASGLKTVIYKDPYTDKNYNEQSVDFLRLNGVNVIQYRGSQ